MIKVTIETRDIVAIFEGQECVVAGKVEAFFDDGEGEDERDCPDCKHFETRLGGPPCSKCRDGDKFEHEPFDGNLCKSCEHEKAYGEHYPCNKCEDGNGEYEPKPEAREFDDNLCGTCKHDDSPSDGTEACLDCPGNVSWAPKPEGGKYKPNYRVHPAETFCDYLDAAGGINEHVAHHLSLAFGPSKDFWLNLWKNYEEAQNESNNGV